MNAPQDHELLLARIAARSELDAASPLVHGEHCTIWQGALVGKQWQAMYGGMKFDGKMLRVHRAVWGAVRGIAYDDIPPLTDDGQRLVIRHLCHVTTCTQDAHLASGTQAENVHDMIAAGRRWPHGHRIKEDVPFPMRAARERENRARRRAQS